MAKSQKKKFTANVKVTVIVGVALTADTMEDALAQAREFNSNDCITVLGENVDWMHTLVGVSSDDWLPYE